MNDNNNNDNNNNNNNNNNKMQNNFFSSWLKGPYSMIDGVNGSLRGLQGLQAYSTFTPHTVLSGPANLCQLCDSVSRVPCYRYDYRLRMLSTAANEG
jgi:hypothetical protein